MEIHQDFKKTCDVCKGAGEYLQTYTAGCGQRSYRMMGQCDYCNGVGIIYELPDGRIYKFRLDR